MGLASQIATRTGQKAVWWRRTGVDETGAPVFAAPAEISVRWEDRAESFFSVDGDERTSVAVVYPDRDLSSRDMLWLGSLSSLPYPDTVRWNLNPNTHEVRRVDKIPNMRGTEYLRVVYL